MKYYSLLNPDNLVSFKEAVIQGIAPDKGLYFPDKIPQLPSTFFDEIENLTTTEIAFRVIQPFVGDAIGADDLRTIIAETLCFDFPTPAVGPKTYALELYHGPTMAFKDVGARFMSRCMAYFNQNISTKNTVLVATSGDTGGAVASGFLGVAGVTVVILYPLGKVSAIQEKQLTTLGQNIKAIAVNGTFDDCQDMVKNAFLDTDLRLLNLTSANSINIARWLPQMFYFFIAYKQLKAQNKPLIVSCPSGNFGNICAGMLAKKLGLPIAHFVAATNANDTVVRFLETQNYSPMPTIATISNAMDVSNPSNFVRILALYNNNLLALKEDLSAYSYSDTDTKNAMQEVYKKYQYITDPHGAIGYLALQEALKKYPDSIGLFLETAHPVKFLDTVQEVLPITLPIPKQIEGVLNKKTEKTNIDSYTELKNFLLNNL